MLVRMILSKLIKSFLTQTVKVKFPENFSAENQVTEDVQKNGDTAIKKYTKKLEKVAV